MTKTSQSDFLLLTMNNIRTHAMLVNAGVRPVALVMVRNECVEECRVSIKKEGLFLVLNPRGEDYTSIYMFKHPCMENVINFALGKPHDRKALMHWINGKMFGYSDVEITRYIVTTLFHKI